MNLCIGDKITVCEEDHENSYNVEEITEDYVKLTNGITYYASADGKEKEEQGLITQQVVNRLHQVEDISYQKAVKILEILMDADGENEN
ncbi:hypothetical protein [Lacrimispora sp. 38-1]|uniref:hypothetical protein n=1 Tax=Lacrimispora sp. 38-1 TaxID=3125778 RepID=UPI003CF424F9